MNICLMISDKADSVKGTMKQFWAPVIVKDISEKTILNSIKWFEDIERLDPKLGDCTYLIFELLTSVSIFFFFPP